MTSRSEGTKKARLTYCIGTPAAVPSARKGRRGINVSRTWVNKSLNKSRVLTRSLRTNNRTLAKKLNAVQMELSRAQEQITKLRDTNGNLQQNIRIKEACLADVLTQASEIAQQTMHMVKRAEEGLGSGETLSSPLHQSVAGTTVLNATVNLDDLKVTDLENIYENENPFVRRDRIPRTPPTRYGAFGDSCDDPNDQESTAFVSESARKSPQKPLAGAGAKANVKSGFEEEVKSNFRNSQAATRQRISRTQSSPPSTRVTATHSHGNRTISPQYRISPRLAQSASSSPSSTSKPSTPRPRESPASRTSHTPSPRFHQSPVPRSRQSVPPAKARHSVSPKGRTTPSPSPTQFSSSNRQSPPAKSRQTPSSNNSPQPHSVQSGNRRAAPTSRQTSSRRPKQAVHHTSPHQTEKKKEKKMKPPNAHSPKTSSNNSSAGRVIRVSTKKPGIMSFAAERQGSETEAVDVVTQQPQATVKRTKTVGTKSTKSRAKGKKESNKEVQATEKPKSAALERTVYDFSLSETMNRTIKLPPTLAEFRKENSDNPESATVQSEATETIGTSKKEEKNVVKDNQDEVSEVTKVRPKEKKKTESEDAKSGSHVKASKSGTTANEEDANHENGPTKTQTKQKRQRGRCKTENNSKAAKVSSTSRAPSAAQRSSSATPFRERQVDEVEDKLADIPTLESLVDRSVEVVEPGGKEPEIEEQVEAEGDFEEDFETQKEKTNSVKGLRRFKRLVTFDDSTEAIDDFAPIVKRQKIIDNMMKPKDSEDEVQSETENKKSSGRSTRGKAVNYKEPKMNRKIRRGDPKWCRE